jgi:hypothetical protein
MKTRRIIAYDMDGTLCKEVCWTVKECLHATPNQKIIDHCNLHYENSITIIYTARQDCLLEATVRWLRIHGVRYWAISNQKLHFDTLYDDNVFNAKEL